MGMCGTLGRQDNKPSSQQSRKREMTMAGVTVGVFDWAVLLLPCSYWSHLRFLPGHFEGAIW